MKLILDEIMWRKSLKTPNKKRIQKLQQLANRKKISLTAFRQTGEIMKMQHYVEEYRPFDASNICMGLRILPNAHSVIRYVGGFALFLLDGDNYAYYYDRKLEVSTDLKELEKMLYKIKVENFITNYIQKD
tara:strand:+ start:1296 stop:1688 length:393 start_codon:yes stop_codon:yes gene_type:complete